MVVAEMEVGSFLQITVRNVCRMAGEEGFEPSLTDPESAVLPLDDSPALRKLYHEAAA